MPNTASQIDNLQEFTKATQDLVRIAQRLTSDSPDAQTIAKAKQALQDSHAQAGTLLDNAHK